MNPPFGLDQEHGLKHPTTSDQGWTVDYHHITSPSKNRYQISDDREETLTAARRLVDEINAALAEHEAELEQKFIRTVGKEEWLKDHDAEVRKPLATANLRLVDALERASKSQFCVNICADALAKVKQT